jgi:hypothetical protein
MTTFSDYLGMASANYAANFGAGLESLGNVAGLDSISSFGKELNDSATQEAVSYGQPDVSSYHDIKSWTDFNGMGDYVKFAVSQAVPALAVSLGGLAIGGGMGLVAGGAGAAGTGAMLGSWLANEPANIGSVSKEMQERGGNTTHDGIAVAAGSLLSTLDAGLLAHVLSPVAGSLIKDVGLDAFKDGLIRQMGVKQSAVEGALKSLAEGGALTAGQQTTQDIIAGMATGNEFTPQELADRALDAAFVGGISMTGLGAWAGGMKAVYNNADFHRLSLIAEQNKKIEDEKQKLFDRALDTLNTNKPTHPEYDMNIAGVSEAFKGVDSNLFGAKQMLSLDVNNDTYGKAQRTSDPNVQLPGFGKMMANYLTGRAGFVLKRMGDVSPAGRQIATKLANFLGKDWEGAQKPDIWEQNDDMISPWNMQKEGYDRNIKSVEDSKKVAAAIRDEKELLALEKSDPALAFTANGYRDLMKQVHLAATAEGFKTGWTPNYLSRFYKTEDIAASPELQKILGDLARMYEGANDHEVHSVLAKIMQGKGIIFPEDLVRGKTNEEKMQSILNGDAYAGKRLGMHETAPRHGSLESERAWGKIPESELIKHGLIHENPHEIITEYLRSATKRIIYARNFGRDEEILRHDLIQASKEMKDAGQELHRHELAHVYGLIDAYHNMHKPILTHAFQRANTLALTSQFIAKLPLALLSSLTEPFVALERMGGGEKGQVGSSLWKATQVAFRGWDAVLKKYPNDQALRYARESAAALDSATMERLASSFGSSDSMRAQFRIPFTDKTVDTQKMTEAFFKYNLLGPFTRLQRIASFHSGVNLIMGNIKELAENSPPEGSRRHERLVTELKDLGINPIEGLRWHQEGANHNSPYFPNIRIGAMRFTNEVVMHPRPNVRPLWHSNPHVALIAQLKGFQTVFGNVVVRRWLTKMFQNDIKGGTIASAHVLGTAAVMMATASLIQQVKGAATWYPNNQLNPAKQDPLNLIYRAANASGIFGGPQFALDAMMAHTFGESPAAPLLGPGPSSAIDLVSAIGSGYQQILKGKTPQSTYTWILKNLPGFGQLPGVRAEMLKQLQDLHF